MSSVDISLFVEVSEIFLLSDFFKIKLQKLQRI